MKRGRIGKGGRGMGSVYPWLASACILAACSLSPAETFTFSNGYDGWTPFTNDGNKVNGWETRGGCLVQLAVNDDTEVFGDRYLVKTLEEPLLGAPGSSFEVIADTMVVDLEGGTGIWQGVVFFANPDQPDAPGGLYIIQEYARDDEVAGLRIVCDGYQSELFDIDPVLQSWHQLHVQVTMNMDGKLAVKAGYYNREDKQTNWLADVVIPAELPVDQPTIALATSAQVGWNTNPAVAFGNIAISRAGTAESEYAHLDLSAVPAVPTRLPDVKTLVNDSVDQISSLSRSQTRSATDIRSNARVLADQVNQAFARKPDPRYMESGFVLASTRETLDDARNLYSELETHCKGRNQKQAAALARWTELLQDTEAKRIDQASLKTEFRKLMHRTQGGISKLVDSEQLAESTLSYATELSATDSQGAQALLDSISDDPVFGLTAARAKLLKAELAGEDLKAAQTAYNQEKAAFDLKELALQDHASKNRTEAVAKLDSLLEQYPDTLQAADARIRKGYIFYAERDDEAAVAAFTEALKKNQSLGADHGLNLEAVARLKYLKHHELYNRTTGEPFFNVCKQEENQPLLDDILQLNETWIQSLPADSPDRYQAMLEQGGILYEQALYLNDPEAWESMRSYLTEMILEEENVDIGIRSIADLMILETYCKEKRYEDCVAASKLMPEKYPKQWKAIGTAKVFEFVSYTWLQKWDEAYATMDWVRETIPADAPHFGKCNYHTVALVSLADQLRKQGNQEEYTRVYNLVQQDQMSSYSGTIKHPEEIQW